MKSIGIKLFTAFLCMSLLIVGVLWFIQAVLMKDNYLNERAKAIDNAIINAAQTGAVNYQALEQGNNISVLVTDSSNNVIYMSQGLPMRGMLMRQIPALAAQGAEGQVVYLKNAAMDMRYAAIGRTLADGGKIYAVFSLVDVEEASRILLQQLWIITAVLLVISILLAIVLARMFAHPIRKVTQAAHDLAGGKLDIHLPVRSRDETGQLTEALNHLAEELQKTEHLKQELIANVSHELRSPLAVIQGFAETVRDVTWPDEQKREQQLSIISAEASRLNKVVKDILDYSRLQAGVDKLSVADFALKPTLNGIMQLYTLEAEKKNLKLILDCEDMPVRFDQGRFDQVLHNLLNNALNHADAQTDIRISAVPHQHVARISVANSGPDIPPEELKNIWERYYRAGDVDGKPLGTGLGLSIVRSILELHQVAYGVVSQNNRTEFWFDTQTID